MAGVGAFHSIACQTTSQTFMYMFHVFHQRGCLERVFRILDMPRSSSKLGYCTNRVSSLGGAGYDAAPSALEGNPGTFSVASRFGSSYGRGLLLNSFFFVLFTLSLFMAMRKVSPSACIRICFPTFGRLLVVLSLFICAIPGWKLCYAGSSDLFALWWSFFTSYHAGWNLRSAGSPDKKRICLSAYASGYRTGSKLLSACSPREGDLVFLICIVCLSGWKLVSASSLEDYSWHCAYIAMNHWLCS